jgi:ATP-dependent protease ClpP protease subunit
MQNIIISGEIGWDVMPSDIRTQLDKAQGADVDIHISSPGGFVFEGIEIYNLIKDYKTQYPDAQIMATLKGLAASMASYIASNPAIDIVTAEDNAVFMIHNPISFAVGDYREMEKNKEILSGITAIMSQSYAARTKKDVSEMRAYMDAETWFFGEEIKAAGFVDEMIGTGEEVDKIAALASAKLRLSGLNDKMKASEKSKQDIFKMAAIITPEPAKEKESNSIIDTVENKNEGVGIMTIKAEMINSDDINLDWLKQNKPDLIEEVKKDAATEEQSRMKEIDQAEENTDDKSEEVKALFKAARYEKPMKAGDVLMEVARITAEKKKKLLADRHEDAAKVPAIPKADIVNDDIVKMTMKAEIKKSKYGRA